MYLSIYLPIYLFIHLSICPFAHLPIYLSATVQTLPHACAGKRDSAVVFQGGTCFATIP